MTAALVAESITKSFTRRRVLRGADLSLETGQITALMGQNGAGKTTFLRILATLLKPESGSLHYFGLPLPGNELSIRARIGVALHASLLYSDLTAEENLRFYARLYGVTHSESRLDELFSLIHLQERRNQSVRTLSRGMSQRLSLGRALIQRPDLLLLDEPFTGLDLESAQWMEEILRDYCAKGGSVLYVSHDFEHIPGLADKACFLDKGTIRQTIAVQGVTPEALRQQYRLICGDEV